MTTRIAALALGAACGVAATVHAAPAAAQPRERCAPMAGGAMSLAGEHAAARLGYIQHHLRRGAARSRVWAATWGSAYAAVSAGQLVRLALSEDREDREQAAIAAASSALGAGFIAFVPPTIIADSARLNARVARMRPGDNQCAVLAEAERYLVRDAANQAFGISWYMQVVTVAYSVGLGLTFGLLHDDWTAGAITTFAGIAASQLMNLTRPTDAIAALRRYRAGDLRPAPRPSTSYWIATPTVGAGHAGVRAGVAF